MQGFIKKARNYLQGRREPTELLKASSGGTAVVVDQVSAGERMPSCAGERTPSCVGEKTTTAGIASRGLLAAGCGQRAHPGRAGELILLVPGSSPSREGEAQRGGGRGVVLAGGGDWGVRGRRAGRRRGLGRAGASCVRV